MKPSRQLGSTGAHPSSAFALAFEAPRIVVAALTALPATRRASQTGTRRGGFAPIARA
jgi:hypothetical protein